MKRQATSFLILLTGLFLNAQDYDLPVGVISLDSVTVTAVRGGLDISDLIEIMQYDSTLYIAWNNLHFTPYTVNSKMTAYDRKDRRQAYEEREVVQTYNGKCREQEILHRNVEGNFLDKRGDQKYYTIDLFNSTFYYENKVCNEKRKTGWSDYLKGGKKEGHLSAIKRVIFNPGSPVDLPLIGNKFALFDGSMADHYDYDIKSHEVSGYDCYVFTVRAKPDAMGSRKEVVVRELVTAFRKQDFQVVDRTYHLFYNGGFVDFDISMHIDMQESEGLFYPGDLSYDGYFNIPTKKPERVLMESSFSIKQNVKD